MNSSGSLVVCFSLGILALSPVCTHAYRAEASLTVLACSGANGLTEGGSNFSFAVVSEHASGVCGPAPEDDAVADAAGLADIANGYVFASANAEGVTGSNRGTGRADISDRLQLGNVGAEVDAVEITASIDLIADYTGSFDFSNDFLFGRISIPAVGQIEIRRCTPFICPNDTIQSDSVSANFTIQRDQFSNEFPPIDVLLQVTIDVTDGGGFFSGQATVSVIDDSGATLSSDSGVFATGGGVDTDVDGIPDALDNCRLLPNADQRDSNDDGFGNRCDPDLNDDLFVNFLDLDIMRDVIFTTDEDADFDGDGNVNFGDLTIMRDFFFSTPGPGASTL